MCKWSSSPWSAFTLEADHDLEIMQLETEAMLQIMRAPHGGRIVPIIPPQRDDMESIQ